MIKNKFNITVLIFATIFLFGCKNGNTLTPDQLPSLKGKNILMVYGGWKGHQPAVFVAKVSKWLESAGAKITLSDSLEVYTNKKIMDATDLIIQYWTMGEITKEQFLGLENAIRKGVGLAGCHGGLGDSFRKNPEYQYIIGGQWVEHPGGKIDYTVNILDLHDPISDGIKDFKIKDTEQYYMHIDPNIKVLATTKFSDSIHLWIKDRVMPIAWKTYYGDGRVFYLSIGHDPKDFDNFNAKELLLRGIRWASGSKYQPKENTLNSVYE
jgi:type 1 glutamine amidotransferase